MTGPRKHTVKVFGQNTSVSLEPIFWKVLVDMVETERTTISRYVESIEAKRDCNLSSAIRQDLMKRMQKAAIRLRSALRVAPLAPDSPSFADRAKKLIDDTASLTV